MDSKESSSSPDNYCILVVDDEPNIRKAMCVALMREGYRIKEAADGMEALEKILGDAPDLVLLDIMLPSMNGFDVAIRVREDRRTRHLPIIIVTAKTQIADRIRGLDIGADDYISKPFDLREMTARVRALLRRVYRPPTTRPFETEERAFVRHDQFENFVVGPTNQVAYNMAVKVAEVPGGVYNPLFIYGESGVGKSHLMHAIGNAVNANDPGASIVAVTSDRLNEQLRSAISDGSEQTIWESYEGADLLLLDDAQFLSFESYSSRKSQILVSIIEKAKQLVVCADRPPEQLTGIPPETRKRMASGSVIRIDLPTPYMRCRILRSMAQQKGWGIPDAILLYVARNVDANVRALEGIVRRIAAENRLMGKPLTKEFVDRLIAEAAKAAH
jgi:chromosomal replication initiator protein DnaA